MALNFVKFQRGSQEAYNRLKLANRLESDALYFIYDKNEPEEGGLLYLGDVLIGGTGAAGVSQLNQLDDVDFGNTYLTDGMILQYNLLTQTWQPKTIKSAVENSGASLSSDVDLPIVASTTKTDQQTLSQALALIDSEPVEGDIVFVNNVPYIYDGSSWKLLVGTALEDRVSSLESSLDTIQQNVSGLSTVVGQMNTTLNSLDTTIANAISSANHLSYEVINTLPTVTEENVGSLNNKVFLVPNNETTGNNRYDEYMYVTDHFESLGSWSVDLSNYVTSTTFESRVGTLESDVSQLSTNLSNYVPFTTYAAEVGNLQNLLTATEKQSTTIVEEIIELHDRLQWHELDSGNDENEPEENP